MPAAQPASVYRRRRALVCLAMVAMVVAVAAVAARVADDDGSPPARGTSGAARSGRAARSSTTTAPSATTTTRPTGRFTRAPGGTAAAGHGTLYRYTVEVEEGTGVDPATFARAVDTTLADPRGWTTADGVSLQRVSDRTATFTVRLATPATTDALCAPLTTKGEVSCGHNAMAVINLTRWLRGAAPSELDLADYRRYVVTHEVGHLLGHPHERCPGAGRPAPPMMQQTYGIGPCTPNPWPLPDT